MITAGIDLGSTTGKAAIIKDGKIILGEIVNCTTKPEETAKLAMDAALKNAGLSSVKDLDYIISTGYGRYKVEFANEDISEITCHAKGAFYVDPTVRTVIDIGGQDCKATALGPKGMPVAFEMNERCSAGTGRFFSVMAGALGCGFDGIGSAANISKTPAQISSQCSVFAESEVISLINNEVPLPDISTGINISIAGRVSTLARRAGVNDKLVVTGGCYSNEGLRQALSQALNVTVVVLPVNPQFMGAVGAAVLAAEKLAKIATQTAAAAATAPVATPPAPAQPAAKPAV